MKSKIDELFGLLDDWRNLPAYQLERRADIFFGLYLKDILSNHFNEEIMKNDELVVIPEFPLLKKVTQEKDKENYLSNKVDYFVWNKSKQMGYFVELKTDTKSIRGKQHAYLLDATCDDLYSIINNILRIIIESKSSSIKYLNLLKNLQVAEVIEGFITPKTKTWRKELKHQTIKVPKIIANKKIKLVYILPKQFGNNITFNEIYFLLKERRDGLSEHFCKALIKWENEV